MEDAVIRPLREEDVAAADAAAFAALKPLWPAEFRPDEAVRAPRGRARVRHLLETDPGGCFVAEVGGEVVGCSLSLVREGIWGYSLLGLREEHQGRGLGRRLFRAAHASAEGCRGQLVLSSTFPAATRTYVRAGLEVRPCMTVTGQVNRSRIPDGLRARPAAPDDEELLAVVDRASRHVRGASHRRDVPALAATGSDLLVLEDRGWAAVREGSPACLAAVDEEAAADLLWSCFASAEPGQSVHVDFVTQGNDWALRVGLDAGLVLDANEGPVLTLGEVGPMRPYLPSGAYL